MRSLLSFVFFLGFLSHTFGFEKPQSCKDYYDPIYILNEDLSDTAFVYREPGFSEPNMARFNIRVNDLKKYQFAAEDAHLIATESILNRRWLSQGIKRLMDSALTYSGLLSGEYRSKIKISAKGLK